MIPKVGIITVLSCNFQFLWVLATELSNCIMVEYSSQFYIRNDSPGYKDFRVF
jgi:hypothetical protein